MMKYVMVVLNSINDILILQNIATPNVFLKTFKIIIYLKRKKKKKKEKKR